jgi:DNA-binding transcriptional MocR family regulator
MYNFLRQAWIVPLRGSVKLVYVAIADAADDDGTCFPSYEYLAHKCGISKSTVIRAVNELKAKKYLQVEERFNNSNIFTLVEISEDWLEKYKWKNRERKSLI